jgi:hypothetical protein
MRVCYDFNDIQLALADQSIRFQYSGCSLLRDIVTLHTAVAVLKRYKAMGRSPICQELGFRDGNQEAEYLCEIAVWELA